MFINYQRLHHHNITETEYHLLMKIHMKYLEDLGDTDIDLCKSLLNRGLFKQIKTGKSFFSKLRISTEGMKILHEIHTYPLGDDLIKLTDDLCDMFESHGVETGNKRTVLENLQWFKEKTIFSDEEIIDALNEWLSNFYQMWLVNIIWDKKKASVYTTMRSRTLSQSPLYEFMRRKYNLKW